MTEIKDIKIIHSKDEAVKRIQAAYGGVVKNLIKETLSDERLIENGVTTSYTYNGLNQLVTESGEETLSYTYDANGNQISVTGGSANKYYSYTPAGMLATYTSGSDSQTNLYNGNGQRIRKDLSIKST